MPKSRRPAKELIRNPSADLFLQSGDFPDRLPIGLWNPHVDICETANRIIVRVELPGVDYADISLTFQGGIMRVQGSKRDPAASCELLCYYCLERRYGRFDRSIPIDWVVDARRARATLKNGILNVELPKLKDRRKERIEIRIEGRKDEES